eukprot:403357421
MQPVSKLNNKDQSLKYDKLKDQINSRNQGNFQDAQSLQANSNKISFLAQKMDLEQQQIQQNQVSQVNFQQSKINQFTNYITNNKSFANSSFLMKRDPSTKILGLIENEVKNGYHKDEVFLSPKVQTKTIDLYSITRDKLQRSQNKDQHFQSCDDQVYSLIDLKRKISYSNENDVNLLIQDNQDQVFQTKTDDLLITDNSRLQRESIGFKSVVMRQNSKSRSNSFIRGSPRRFLQRENILQQDQRPRSPSQDISNSNKSPSRERYFHSLSSPRKEQSQIDHLNSSDFNTNQGIQQNEDIQDTSQLNNSNYLHLSSQKIKEASQRLQQLNEQFDQRHNELFNSKSKYEVEDFNNPQNSKYQDTQQHSKVLQINELMQQSPSSEISPIKDSSQKSVSNNIGLRLQTFMNKKPITPSMKQRIMTTDDSQIMSNSLLNISDIDPESQSKPKSKFNDKIQQLREKINRPQIQMTPKRVRKIEEIEKDQQDISATSKQQKDGIMSTTYAMDVNESFGLNKNIGRMKNSRSDEDFNKGQSLRQSVESQDMVHLQIQSQQNSLKNSLIRQSEDLGSLNDRVQTPQMPSEQNQDLLFQSDLTEKAQVQHNLQVDPQNLKIMSQIIQRDEVNRAVLINDNEDLQDSNMKSKIQKLEQERQRIKEIDTQMLQQQELLQKMEEEKTEVLQLSPQNEKNATM